MTVLTTWALTNVEMVKKQSRYFTEMRKIKEAIDGKAIKNIQNTQDHYKRDYDKRASYYQCTYVYDIMCNWYSHFAFFHGAERFLY